jgi:hypothetical protein
MYKFRVPESDYLRFLKFGLAPKFLHVAIILTIISYSIFFFSGLAYIYYQLYNRGEILRNKKKK